MMLFTRTLTLRGSPSQVLPWATEITQLVNDRSELDVSLWTIVYGEPVGTLAWSSIVGSRAELAASTSALLADPDYHGLIDKARDWVVEPAVDALRSVIHTAGPEYRRADVGMVVEMITAELAPGRYAAGLTWSTEITDMSAGITDAATMFCKDAYGQFGQVTWVASFPDIADVDRAQEALDKDGEYLAKLDSARDLFIAGSGRQGLAQRIA